MAISRDHDLEDESVELQGTEAVTCGLFDPLDASCGCSAGVIREVMPGQGGVKVADPSS
jgi:hypothetical protein